MICTPSPWPPMPEWPTNLMPCDATAVLRRARAGDLAEHRAVGEARAAGIVEPENPADQLTRGVEAGNGFSIRTQDLCVGVDPQAAETERDAAGDCVRFEWRCVERVGPV